tara:strand:- start:1763 stop:2173 length:411 start_codon:yes stop_codon:yes gene_type:complete
MKAYYLTLTLTCLFVLAIQAQAAASDSRDPFSPYNTWNTPSASGEAETDKNKHANKPPIERDPVRTYAVIGLIVSPDNAVAVVKSLNNHEFFVQVGDHIGNEGGVIESIHTDGITVDTGSSIVTLNVSNNFEIPNE